MDKISNLVIVESPAKAKTIEKILGKEYHVLSSYGHIRDLKKSGFGIDLEDNFRPDYIVSEEKKKVVAELRAAAKKADVVWLASDEDREGEAIAWHLYEVLERKGKTTKRIVFHEITPNAIFHAIENPRDIDINLVNAQQARRVLDRIVGFELSPILWRRIKPSLSAGRVQSVALRLICDREEEVKAFETSSSYKVSATLSAAHSNVTFEAEAAKTFSEAEEAKAFMTHNATQGALIVKSVEGKPAKRAPAPPFTTSTLQQEAARKLGFSVSRTMSVAQKLYESGYITYMRTDSTNLSTLALSTAERAIKEKWGEKYHKRRTYHTKSKGAQEAHEAIRPTYMEQEEIKGDAVAIKLYRLIRMRTLASQMSEALFEKTVASIENEETKEKFIATGEVMLFDGFLSVYNDTISDDGGKKKAVSEKSLPSLSSGQLLISHVFLASEHYTYPPARYTEASLVKKMEELGIGRPSTYAPTIQTLFNREYVILGSSAGVERIYRDFVVKVGKTGAAEPKEKPRKEKTGSDKGKLLPTDIGVVVNNYLVEHFPRIIEYNFTAQLEEEFDRIALGEHPWTDSMQKFYTLFHPMVEEALEQKNSASRGERELGIDPKSGRKVIARIARFGPIIQIGTADDGSDEKPRFVPLSPKQSITTITLEEVLDLMRLPRKLGIYEEQDLKANIGRFGPYIQLGSLFATIPKEQDPFSISFEEAVALIEAKREAEQKSILRAFAEDPELTVRQGRFGAYIRYRKSNIKLSKEKREQVEKMTYEELKEIVNAAAPKKSEKKKSSTPKKAITKKTTTAKKKTP